MEGSGEMNSGDDKALTGKKRTKIVKTPSQIEGLEKFYDEHKYPTESLKLQLAKDIGLTEKQVSSWFCHRRLKDKRFPNAAIYANRRQDLPNGVVPDSCESTKQGENKAPDPIEVQSTRFNSQKLSGTDLKLEHASLLAGNFSHRDDGTSSGGSSSKHNLYSKVDRVHMTASKLSAQNVVNYVNFGKPRSGPSGYLKVKRCVDNPAVTAVKKQLGAHYREDGPPLGIAFDPLPPGAFEPLNEQPEETLNSSETYSAGEYVGGRSPDVQGIHQEYTSKPYHIEEDSMLHSAGGSRVHKQQIPNAGYGGTSNMIFPKTVLDGKNSRIVHKSAQSGSFFLQKHNQEFSLSEHRPVNMHEDCLPDMAIYDKRIKYEGRSMSSSGGSRRGASSAHHQFQPYRGEVNEEQEEPWLKNSHGRMPKIEKRDSFNPGYSDLMARGRRNDAYGDISLPHKAAKVDSFYGIKREKDDDVTVRLRIPRNNEFHTVKDEYHQHVRKV